MVSHLTQAWRRLAGMLLIALISAGALSQDAASPSQQLADILQDDAARAQLIEELRGAASRLPEGAVTGSAESVSFSQTLATTTQSIAQGILNDGIAAVEALMSLNSEQSDFVIADFVSGLIGLLIVGAITLVAAGAFRGMARPVFRRAAGMATEATFIRRTGAVIWATAFDALVILAAWLVGYVAVALLGSLTEATSAYAALFLNAFLFIELFTVTLRVFFAARDDSLRLLPMGAENAAYWYAWLARLSTFLGYGLLLVVPVLNNSVSAALGRGATFVVVLVAFVYAVTVIMQNRAGVSAQFREAAAASHSQVAGFGYKLLGRVWHVLAIGYFLALGLVVLSRPEDALPVMLQSTAQMAISIAVGILLAVLLNQLLRRPHFLNDEVRARFPMLDERLGSFVPTVLKVLDVVILLAVIGAVLDAWGLFDFGTWLVSDAGSALILTAITVGLVLAAAKGLWIVLASWIEFRLSPETGEGEPTAREKTLLTIFRNAIMVAIIIMTMMIVLAEIGINIGPLIAGAGVLGLAIGFGSQKLVQDIITGIFIQMENAINAGDVVTAGGITGTAEKLTVRSLSIRDLNGTYHIIPFSSVDTVSNFMRDFAYHVGVYGVAYREDTDEVIHHLKAAFEELKQDETHRPNILDDELEVHGVTALADSSVNIRVRIKAVAGTQWGIGRAYNRLVKRHLDAAGIEIPFPHMTLYFGQDKDGSAPPAPIRLDKPSES